MHADRHFIAQTLVPSANLQKFDVDHFSEACDAEINTLIGLLLRLSLALSECCVLNWAFFLVRETCDARIGARPRISCRLAEKAAVPSFRRGVPSLNTTRCTAQISLRFATPCCW